MAFWQIGEQPNRNAGGKSRQIEWIRLAFWTFFPQRCRAYRCIFSVCVQKPILVSLMYSFIHFMYVMQPNGTLFNIWKLIALGFFYFEVSEKLKMLLETPNEGLWNGKTEISPIVRSSMHECKLHREAIQLLKCRQVDVNGQRFVQHRMASEDNKIINISYTFTIVLCIVHVRQLTCDQTTIIITS